MIDFFNAVSAVLILLMLMSIGYIMGRLGWMGTREKAFLSKFLLNIAVPCTCITGILNNLDRDMLSRLALMFAAAVTSVVIMLLLSSGLAKLLKLPRKRQGVFICMCSFSNTLFVGLPVTTQLFGDKCIPYVMVYYLSSTLLVQTMGVLLIEYSGSGKRNSGFKTILKSVLTKAPILGIIAAMTLLLLNFRPPEFIMAFMGYISGTVSPLALIYCGFVMLEIGLKNLRLEKGFVVMLLCRLVVSPVICLALCTLFKIELFPRSVLLVESALPVITQVTVMCGEYGADEQYCASGASISLLCSFITIPVWMVILG